MGGVGDEARKIEKADFDRIREAKRIRVINTRDGEFDGFYEQTDANTVPTFTDDGVVYVNTKTVAFIRTGNTYNNAEYGEMTEAHYLLVYGILDEETDSYKDYRARCLFHEV